MLHVRHKGVDKKRFANLLDNDGVGLEPDASAELGHRLDGFLRMAGVVGHRRKKLHLVLQVGVVRRLEPEP